MRPFMPLLSSYKIRFKLKKKKKKLSEKINKKKQTISYPARALTGCQYWTGESEEVELNNIKSKVNQ